MLRGMDNHCADIDDEDGSVSTNTRNVVSVNFASDVKAIPDRRLSRDTDTESFTYEHFPVVCPTCRGIGKVHEDDINELVSFVPVKDERLRPSRIFCKMLIMLLVCICIAAPLAFFLIPRSVTIALTYEKSTQISTPDNITLVPFIIMKSELLVNNQNYLSVKVTNVNVEVSWNKLIINAGTCIQNVSLVVPARKILKKSFDIRVIFNGHQRGTAGFLFRKNCANGYRNHIFVKFATTAKVKFLTQDSQVSSSNYPYVQCYNFSGISEDFWTTTKRRYTVHQSL